MCNALIQRHFDYVCSAWYPNLNKKFKSKLQIVINQNPMEWKTLKKLANCLLPVSERFNHYLCSNTVKFSKGSFLCFLFSWDIYIYIIWSKSGQNHLGWWLAHLVSWFTCNTRMIVNAASMIQFPVQCQIILNSCSVTKTLNHIINQSNGESHQVACSQVNPSSSVIKNMW